MNLHVFVIRTGEQEFTEFLIAPADIKTPKDAISYMYGEEILGTPANSTGGVDYYWWGDTMVGHYKCFPSVTSNEIEVLQKFWVV